MSAEGSDAREVKRPTTPRLRRLLHLMLARLAICGGILAVALALIGVGEETGGAAERGLYGTVACAFLATVLFGAAYGRVRNLALFGAVQLATDVALATSLVHFSGGSDSLFSFLYVPITVYGAFLFGRRGAYGASALGALAFGALLLARSAGWLEAHGSAPSPGPVQLAVWGIHTGALLFVALLASTLSRELDRAGRALDERTQALRNLRWLHQRTVESLTSGLLTIDPQGRITSFNPTAERITGASAQQVLTQPLDDVIPGARELVEKSCQAGEARGRLRAQLRFCNRHGQELHLGLAGSILREEHGSPQGYVVIFQDVTRTVEMQQELRRRERLAVAGQLAANLAHEIRNPLAAISGSLQMLQTVGEGTVRGAESRRLMQIVLRETDRLDGLITDFLQYARPTPPHREPVPVAGLVREVLEVFDSVRPPQVKVVLEVSPQLTVLADARQLRQLLWNLFLNAIQAMPEGGELRVSGRPLKAQEGFEGDRNAGGEGSAHAEIEVADTGVGIPDEVLDRIFEPFFTSKQEGSGLGLATVHRIVESHEGHLSVQSVVGRGTTFRIRLPRAEERA